MLITKGIPLIAVCCLWGAFPPTAAASDVRGANAASAPHQGENTDRDRLKSRHANRLSPAKRKVQPRITGGDLFRPRYWGMSGLATDDALHVLPTGAAHAQTRTQHPAITGLPLRGQAPDQVPERAMSAVAMQMQGQFPGQSLKTIPGQMTGQQTAAQVPEQVPFTFVGRMIDGNKVTLFVTQNDHQFLAKVNDVIGGAYRVDSISGTNAVLTYLPTNTQQTLMFNSTAIGSSAIGDTEAGGTTGRAASAAGTELSPPAEKLTIK